MRIKLFVILFLFSLNVYAQNVRIEYNPRTNTYHARPNVRDRVTYEGWINPNELTNSGFRVGYDIWEIDLVRPQTTIDITSANIANIQSIVDALDATQINRLFFRAGTYRNVTINCKAKHGLQIVGETDAQGNNLVTINGAILLNSWSANSGKFRHAVSNYNALVDASADLQSYFFAGFLNVSNNLIFNNIPLIAVASIAEVNDNTKFFYDAPNGFVYVNFNPAANTIEWAQQESFVHCGATAANYPNATNGVAVSNFNFVNFAGTSRSGVVGGRNYTHTTGSIYPVGSAVSGWFVQNCVFDRNAGISIFLHSRSTAFRNRISNSGLMSMTSVYAGVELGYTTTISTSFLNNIVENDNWRGMDSGYANGLKVVGQYKVLIRGNTVRNQGVIYHNRTVKCNGIWLDFCDAGLGNESVIENNTVYVTHDNAIHIEGTGYTFVRNNNIYDAILTQIAPAPHGLIYISTSNNIIVENNRLNPRLALPSNAFEVKSITYLQTTRGVSLFTGVTLTTRSITSRNNDYTMSNTAGGTLIEYNNGTTATSPVWLWAVNNKLVSYSNIFRQIISTTNFIQTGSSTDNLSVFQGRNPSFERASIIQ